VFTYRLGIVEGRADGPGMERVVIVLIDILVGIEFIESILRSVVPVAVVDIGGPGEVQGQGTIGLFELMPEGKVRAIDIKSGVFTG